MQPYLFPYIGYWQLIYAVDKFVIFDDVNYKKKGHINRNKILVEGKPFQFTLNLKGASQNKLINEIQIGDNVQNILNLIEYNYKKSPYFKKVFSLLEEIFNQEEKNLAKFIGYSLKKISNYLEIDVKFIFSSEIDKNNQLKNQNKIINICQKLKATNYINVISGKELFDKEIFLKNKIKLNFINTNSFKYQQFNNEFIPFLSIIDVMMFNDLDTLKIIINQYNLVD